MAFGVAGAIGAVAIKLRFAFGDDLCTCLPRGFAVGVDVFGEMHVDGLGAEAADGPGGFVIGAPFGSNHDLSIAIDHLAVGDIAVFVFDQEIEFEAEGVSEEIEGGSWIKIGDGGGDWHRYDD